MANRHAHNHPVGRQVFHESPTEKARSAEHDHRGHTLRRLGIEVSISGPSIALLTPWVAVHRIAEFLPKARFIRCDEAQKPVLLRSNLMPKNQIDAFASYLPQQSGLAEETTL